MIRSDWIVVAPVTPALLQRPRAPRKLGRGRLSDSPETGADALDAVSRCHCWLACKTASAAAAVLPLPLTLFFCKVKEDRHCCCIPSFAAASSLPCPASRVKKMLLGNRARSNPRTVLLKIVLLSLFNRNLRNRIFVTVVNLCALVEAITNRNQPNPTDVVGCASQECRERGYSIAFPER